MRYDGHCLEICAHWIHACQILIYQKIRLNQRTQEYFFRPPELQPLKSGNDAVSDWVSSGPRPFCLLASCGTQVVSVYSLLVNKCLWDETGLRWVRRSLCGRH